MTERTVTRTGVCIGGPLDRKLKHVLHGNSFSTIENHERHVYVGETLHVGHDVYMFWRYENITVNEAIRSLLFIYAKEKPPNVG